MHLPAYSTRDAGKAQEKASTSLDSGLFFFFFFKVLLFDSWFMVSVCLSSSGGTRGVTTRERIARVRLLSPALSNFL